MTDQYMDQYKNEMAQVHAPMDLIEKTKAAVREEEERILRERRGQEETKRVKRFTARKWAYPLTAAVALLILASVSLTMKGIKRNSSGMSGAAYEESAEADAGFAEGAVLESQADAGASAELTAEDASVDMPVELVEEEMTVEPVAEETALEAADEAPLEAAAGGAQKTEAVEESATPSINEVQRSTEERKQAADMTGDMAQDVEDAKAAKGDLDLITIEKTESKPAFCDLPDTKSHIYEGKTFLVRKEKSGWTAYVEAENGMGYVLRGEAENVVEFLKTGNEKLSQLDMME